MTRSKFVAILTGAIAIILSILYLLVVQILDFRGEMVPAPVSVRPELVQIVDLALQPSSLGPTDSTVGSCM